MDLFTQALLGGALAQSAMRKSERKLATFTGMAAGMLADADILIRSAQDPLLTLEYHRHFSHALIFIPIGAFIAACICWLFVRKQHAFSRVYLYALLGYALSGLLDACTSYGTHLLWPFSDERIAWHVVAVVDPLFSVALLVGLVMSYRSGSMSAARSALLFCACYLLLGAFQLHRAEQQMIELADSRGHRVERYTVKPTLGNLLLWRSVYQYGDVYHADAIRVGLGENKSYTGHSTRAVDIESAFADIDSDSVLYDDIRRFSHFSDGFITLHPDNENVIGDIRYSMMPNSVVPLWGIELDRTTPNMHAEQVFFREQDADTRARFVDMLLGR